MKILIISNCYPNKNRPYLCVFIKNLYDALNKNQLDVNCVVLSLTGKESKFKKILKYVKYHLNALYNILTNKYDIIHINYVSHNVLITIFTKVFSKAKIVNNYHGSDLYELNQKWFYQFINKISDMLIFPSFTFKNNVEEKTGKSTSGYIFPSSGVDQNIFKYHYNQFAQNILKDTIEIAYVSSVNSEKGIHEAIEAVNDVNTTTTKDTKVKLHIIGSGSDLHYIKNYKSKYINIIGPVQQKSIPNYLKTCSLFLFPSKRTKTESLGLVPLEAMSMGLPIIASDIPITKEYVTDGNNGYIFEKGNSKELADKIILYQKLSINEKIAMSKSAYKTSKKYEQKFVIEELIKEYSKLIANNKSKK